MLVESRGMWVILFAALTAATLCSSLPAQQITGAIVGTVSDPAGAPIPNAEVTVTEAATQQAIVSRTDALGGFVAPYLKPGRYAVRVQAPGFKTALRENIEVQVDAQVRLPFRLEVGEVTTEISIREQLPLVETEKGALGQVVPERAIADLPLQGRNVFDLVGLAAGVQTSPLGDGRVISSGSATGLAIFVAADISINGGRFRTNEFLLDGISIMLPVQQQFALSPSPDSTQEFKVMSNSYGPQFGRSGGGVINVVTRGGTNEFHGAAYEMFRNDRLKANNYFANARNQSRGVFHFNMFGGALGGPIVRNRTFFFADYQGHRENSALGGRSLTIPTAAQRQGDFSTLFNAQGQPVLIYDPYTTRRNPAGTAYIRDAFPGNRIPAARFDRAAARIQQYVPLPNRPGEGPANLNNWAYYSREDTRSDQWSVRLDHRFSERHSVFGRFTRNTGDSENPGEFGTAADTQHIRFTNDTFNTVINGTFVFSPVSVFNYRLGATRRDGNQVTAPSGSVSLTELGFPPAVAAAAQKETFPQISFTGYAQIGTPPDAPQTNDIYTIVAEQTQIRGRHTLTYGADLRLYNQNVFRPTNASGNYSFTRGFTQGPDPQRASLTAGDAWASFLTGYGSGNIQNTPAFAVRNAYIAGFFNDDVRWRRLTLNVGLRWEYEQPRTERYNRFSTFDFTRPFPIRVPGMPQLYGVLTHPGRDGEPRGNFDTFRKGFGPRVGLAYRWRDRTVLRSGYGIFFLPRQGYPNATQFGAAGFQIVTTWIASIDGITPVNPLSNPYPGGLLQPPTSQAEILQLGQAITINPRYNKNNAYVQHWNLGLQTELPGRWLLEAVYAGNQGVRLPVSVQFNQVHPQFQSLGNNLTRRVDNPFYGLIGTGALSTPTISLNQLLRPFPQYGNIDSNLNHTAASKYHSLQLRTERRLARGGLLLLTYTASKMIDDGSGRVVNFTAFRPPAQNQYDLRAERAVSQQDVSQRLNISHVLDFPFGRGRRFLNQGPGPLLRLVGGWSVQGTAVFSTGFPLALTSSGNSGVFSPSLRPNNTGQSAELSGSAQSRLNRYFNTDVFRIPDPFTFGNTGRTLPDVRGPGRRNYNLAVSKSTAILERFNLVFRAEAFNLTNTPFFMPPATSLGDASFGVISEALGERQVQFGLRLVF